MYGVLSVGRRKALCFVSNVILDTLPNDNRSTNPDLGHSTHFYILYLNFFHPQGGKCKCQLYSFQNKEWPGLKQVGMQEV